MLLALALDVPLWVLVLASVSAAIVFAFHSQLLDLIVLWVIANNGRARRLKTDLKARLQAYVVRSALLDHIAINELFVLARDMVDADQIGIDIFHKYVLSYKYTLIFRDRLDGSLRGMMLISPEKGVSPDNRRFIFIKCGLGLFKEEFRGGPLFYMVGFYFLMAEMLAHPFTPIYVLYKSFSVKSYQLALRNFQEVYPRYDKPTPAWEKSIMDDFGRNTASGKEVYDADRCVVNREVTHLREGVVRLSKEDLMDPHVQFFVKQNPGWLRGHLMISLCRVRWSDVFRIAGNLARRSARVFISSTLKAAGFGGVARRAFGSVSAEAVKEQEAELETRDRSRSFGERVASARIQHVDIMSSEAISPQQQQRACVSYAFSAKRF